MKERLKIFNIVGARPNFIKVASIHRALIKSPEIISKIIHTGQHYDSAMSDIFFSQLELPIPDYFLGVGSGSHTEVTAKIMIEFEIILKKDRPDVILVVGDVNSTVACALVAVKMGIPLVHVEAGLRSGDRAMPEELNRVITDSISNILFVTEQSGMVNLAKEGVDDSRIFFVGNVMIDSLVYYRNKKIDLLKGMGIEKKNYALMTMHRPSNVDNLKGLENIIQIIENTVDKVPIVFPMHPRTLNQIKKFNLEETFKSIKGLYLLEPQGYLQFISLMDDSLLIITDSGGIQEESTYLGVPCITFRNSTERPVTVDLGTNILISELDPLKVSLHINKVLGGEIGFNSIPPKWDGNASKRIKNIILDCFLPN